MGGENFSQPKPDDEKGMTRRDFLKWMGIAAVATTGVAKAGESAFKKLEVLDQERVSANTHKISEVAEHPEKYDGNMIVQGFLQKYSEEEHNILMGEAGVTKGDLRDSWFRLFESADLQGPSILVLDRNMNMLNGMISETPKSELDTAESRVILEGDWFHDGDSGNIKAPNDEKDFLFLRFDPVQTTERYKSK